MATYWVTNNGPGDGNSQGSPTFLGNVWGRLVPGDIVMLISSIYRGGINMLRPPAGLSGQSGSPITIKAFDESDPSAVPLFDGQFQINPVRLYKNSWFVLEGFNIKNGHGGLVEITTGSHRNIVRRVVGWDVLWNGNNEHFAVHFGSTFNLFEDCASFGHGRKLVNNTQTGFGNDGVPGASNDGTVFRRFWCQHHGSGDDGISVFDTAYNSYGATYENVIGSVDQKYGAQTYTRTSNGNDVGLGSNEGDYRTINSGGLVAAGGGGSFGIDNGTFRGVFGDCYNVKLLGNIAYLKRDHIYHPNGNDFNGLGVPMLYMAWYLNCFTVRDHLSYIDPLNDRYQKFRGVALSPPDTSITSGASNSAQNVTSVRSNAPGAEDIYGANWGVAGSLSQGFTASQVQNPFTASSVGARLCHRYVNGVLTDQPLWPWPMEARIFAATSMAGRYEGPCLGCSGGRAPRVGISVTQDIESIFGPIPSECRGSVGSNPPPPSVPPGVPPPPETFGAGPRGVDIVGKSEFVRLESSARAINVSDTRLPTERVSFPITLEQQPNDVSEAATAGYALTWLVDLRQTIGTGLSEADLLYAGLDVETLNPPYQARIIGNPAVNRELMDTFWGTTEISGIAVTLSNADGRLTPLYRAVDLRGQTIILRRYDFRTGETIDELYAKISSVGIGPGVITVTASSPDMSLFEREIPTARVTTERFPKAIDVGAVIPVVFGTSARVPLLYVNDDVELGQFDYLVGHDTITVSAVYFVRPDGGFTQIPVQDWAVRTDIYPGLTVIRFTNRQTDASGRTRTIVADVAGASRNFARNIQSLMAGPNAWGLNGSAGAVDTASFDTAAAMLDQLQFFFCDGVIREARQAQDILRELMIVRGMRLVFTAQGRWGLTVDAPRFTARMAIGDGRADGPRNILSAGQRRRPETKDAVSTYSIRYRLDFVRGAYQRNLTRVVNPTIGREKSLESNFVRDNQTADRIVDYLSKREIFTSETSEYRVSQEGRRLTEGDLVQVTYLPFDFLRTILEVRKVTKRLESVDVVLNGSGTAGDIPDDSLNGVPIGGGGSGPNNGGTGGGGEGGTGTGPDTGGGGGDTGGGGPGSGGGGGAGGDGGFNDIFIPTPDPNVPPPGTDPDGGDPDDGSTRPFVVYAPGGYQLVGRFLDTDFDGCEALLEWHRIAEVIPGFSDEDNLVNHEVRDYQIEVWGEDEVLRRTEYTFVPTYTYPIEKNRIDFPPVGSRVIKFILRGRTHSGTLGMPNSIWVRKTVTDL